MRIIKLLIVSLFLMGQLSYAQIVDDSIYINNVNNTFQQDDNPLYSDYSTKYYRWVKPVFDDIDIDALQKTKSEHEAYLSEISLLETILSKNKTELKRYQSELKELQKALSNDKKNAKERRRYFKDEEKMLKKEKKMRDKELKMLRKERKELRKNSKDYSSYQMDEYLINISNRENRLQYANDVWIQKQDRLKYDMTSLVEVENEIREKDVELNNRKRELDGYANQLTLKQKQLKLEKKQVNLEMKRAKKALKLEEKFK